VTRRVMRALTALVAVVLLAQPACAQVEVVEPGAAGAPPAPRSAAVPSSSKATVAAAAGNSSGELFYQLQVLQDELMKLRGIVEEQGEELRQLKQQRLDDYISLDRRIGGGSAAPPPGPAPASDVPIDATQAPSAPAPSMAASTAPRTAPAAGEEPAYQAAYERVRNRQFPEAIVAFNDFVAQYPNGSYTGNAHYWLGELYLLDGDNAAAKRNFETLLNNFGDNRKVPDAMFKLGRIYHQDGDDARAKELLQKVANDYAGSDSSAPRLAREYLQQNF